MFGLPVFIDGVDIDDIMRGIAGDKKKSGDKVDFVLLRGLGNAVVESMELSEIKDGLENLRKYYR